MAFKLAFKKDLIVRCSNMFLKKVNIIKEKALAVKKKYLLLVIY